jgi:Zn-dependent protease/CBS domain-containing protein
MIGRRMTGFHLFGFDVRLDVSWVILGVLTVWTFAVGVLPASLPDLDDGVYWAMAVAGAVGLFVSIIVHELSHSIVARRLGLPIRAITLFVFGGAAETEDEPCSVRTELLTAIAGPASTAVLGGAFYGLAVLLDAVGSWTAVVTVLALVAEINLLLTAFNLVPAFPLDGGRVLRALLWRVTGDLRRATRVATLLGSGFGFLLIGSGAVLLFQGQLVAGIWALLIGSFVQRAAQSSYRRLLTRLMLRGETVRRFMREDPVTVPYYISVEQLVEEYVYRHHHRLYPVMQDDKLVGCITTRDIKRLPREDWSQHTVKEMSQACTAENTTAPDVDALVALRRMSRSGTSRLMVVDGDRLVGILTLGDLLQYLVLKTDLEGRDATRAAEPWSA